MRITRRNKNLAFALLAFLAAGATACGGALPPDRDGDYTKSAHLFSGVSVGDTIDPRRGDKEDWRKFRFVEDTKISLLVVMAPLQVNPVRGKIEVYDDTFAHVRGSPLQPGHNRYELVFEVTAGQDYYVVLLAEKGSAPYQIRLEGVAVDPCAACGEGEMCQGGQCVKVVVPEPPSDNCGGCPEGRECDSEIRECVTPECVGVRCPDGQYCNRRGRCAKRSGGAKPRCGPGESRVRGACVPDDDPLPDTKITVRANIVSIHAGAKGMADLEVDKGKIQGLKVGMKGRIPGMPGVSVKIFRVFEVRSRAHVSVPASALTERARVVVFPIPD